MDYCSLDDAFPVFAAAAGEVKESKNERKKTRKNRHADVKTIEMPPIEAIPIRDNIEPDRDRFRKEAIPPPLKSADESVPHIITPPEAVPVPVPGPAAAPSQDNWFGGYEDDDAASTVMFPTSTEEAFMPYKGSGVVEGEYSLLPDFAKTFTASGLDRAAGINYEEPAKRGSLFEKLTSLRGGNGAAALAASPELQKQVAAILKRLDRLETSQNTAAVDYSENSNMEILMFTMSGIFVMFLMDVMVRSGK
jgi:hypothetical protein